MFKNINLYRIGADWAMHASDIEAQLDKLRFQPCGKLQTKSMGWVPPRGIEHAALVESQGRHQVLRLCVETKTVPSKILDRRVDELAKALEEQTGRRPGKKARKALKEQTFEELIPAAFPKSQDISVWIDNGAQLIIVDTASEAKADEAITMLVASLPGLNVGRFVTSADPGRAMTGWLLQGAGPDQFNIDREVDLKSNDQTKAVASYRHCNLDAQEIKDRIRNGLVPTKLGLTWMGRVSFVLTDTCQVKRVEFLDVVLKDRHVGAADEAFDADLTIAVGELMHLITDLIYALGGLVAADLFMAAAAADDQARADNQQGLDFAQNDPAGAPSDADLMASIDGDDPLYEQAVNTVLTHRKASISLVQRHLRVGYNRAARLLDQMEAGGVVSAMAANGNRTILIPGESA